MATLVAHLDDIQSRLDALARRHEVPGAALAVGLGDELLDFATGVANRRTGVATTTDTVFQIGSNTKVMTTTLIMQLVEAGVADLDKPVSEYLPGLDLGAPGAADTITLRHLLTHTSGLQGDHFADFGRGDGGTRRYVESLSGLVPVHEPGRLWSYCNSGFTLAGHIAERITGLPFHQLLRERICDPLGLDSVTVVAEEMLARRCAVGHARGPDGTMTVPPVVIMAMASAPAGSRTVATAADLARFARAHLAGGTRDGARLLSPASAAAMQEPQVDRPRDSDMPAMQGLGWRLSDWDGVRVIGHGGGTIGQISFLQAIPERDLVVVLLTNSPTPTGLWHDLGGWLFETLAGVRVPRVPRPHGPVPDLLPLDHYAGRYERLGARFEITIDDGTLMFRAEPTDVLADIQTVPLSPAHPLQPVDRESFYLADADGDSLITFHEFTNGRPAYLHTGRANRRTASAIPPR